MAIADRKSPERKSSFKKNIQDEVSFNKLGHHLRKDGRIKNLNPHDLPSGLRLGFPDPNAFAATVMTRQYMQHHGINVDRRFHIHYFGSQDSALMALYSGMVDIIGTWRPSLRSMPADVRKALRIIAETPPQPPSVRPAARVKGDLIHLCVFIQKTPPSADVDEIVPRLGADLRARVEIHPRSEAHPRADNGDARLEIRGQPPAKPRPQRGNQQGEAQGVGNDTRCHEQHTGDENHQTLDHLGCGKLALGDGLVDPQHRAITLAAGQGGAAGDPGSGRERGIPAATPRPAGGAGGPAAGRRPPPRAGAAHSATSTAAARTPRTAETVTTGRGPTCSLAARPQRLMPS